MDGEGFAIEGWGLGINGGGSGCIDLDPLFMIGSGSGD